MYARIYRGAWMLVVACSLGVGLATADPRVINMNGIPCDTQCQVDGLRTQVKALDGQVKALQEQVDKTPKPIFAYCKDTHTLASSNGQTWACDPYICQGTACVKQCGNVRDCAAPNVCNAQGACVRP